MTWEIPFGQVIKTRSTLDVAYLVSRGYEVIFYDAKEKEWTMAPKKVIGDA